jgi:hypothetical protein
VSGRMAAARKLAGQWGEGGLNVSARYNITRGNT